MAEHVPHSLAILVPVTSRRTPPDAQGAGCGEPDAVIAGLRRLAASMAGAPDTRQCRVLLGIDSDDAAMLERQQAAVDAFAGSGLSTGVVVFSEADRAGAPRGAVCQLWGLLAGAALARGCTLAVLLGDDTELSPAGWPRLVLERFAEQPELQLLLLRDAADPGFPSFPVLRLEHHMQALGRLLPACFLNQGGDPFLAALYRRFAGCLAELPAVSVVNRVGGVQLSGQPYSAPRYTRSAPSKAQALAALHAAAPAVARQLPAPRQLTVDVLVPTYRVALKLLQGIVDAVLQEPAPPGTDLHLILVVDRAHADVTAEQAAWLAELQARWLHRVRVRFNERNLGAPATRNRALEESLADWEVFWDDDIIPAPGCLAAYIGAITKHPSARGFAGPSFIPVQPDSVWCCAVHLADVLFFWAAAADWRAAEVLPWAVTANVALVNSAELFDLRFPKTGGGEEIDFCLRVAGGRVVPVPEAAVHHPLWSGGRRCYGRFFGWAFGDGALIIKYPGLCYTTAPNSAEVLSLLLVAAAAAAPAALLGAVAGGGRILGATLAAAAAFKAADVLLDVWRAFTPARVLQHPSMFWKLRLAAAAEASFIKTWSEAGRLWGHVCRGEPLWVVMRRFDWFCGLVPAVVVGEQQRACARFVVCSLSAVTVAACLLARL